MERRITHKNEPHDRDNRLKHIAGLISNLTFREMKELADHVHQEVDTPREGLEDQLIKLSDRILTSDKGTVR